MRLKLKYSLLTFLAAVTVACISLAVLYGPRSSESIKTLVDLGASVELREDGYYMEIPDLIDPEIAVGCLKNIKNVEHIHFVSGESPPAGKVYLRTWSWDDKEASRRIDMFRNALPETSFTFWPGAF